MNVVLVTPVLGSDTNMKKATIVGGKVVSLRLDPSDTKLSEETYSELKVGETVTVDTEDSCWSWDDKRFLRATSSDGTKGYVNVDCLQFMER